MTTCLVRAPKPFQILLLLVLCSLLPAWTCTAIIGFNSCLEAVPEPQIVSLAPDTISVDMNSVALTVAGTGFVTQSEILWNGNPLPTTFMDSRHLQATITQQTLDSIAGSAGASVLISVISPQSSVVVGCPNGGTSGTLILVVN